MKILVLLVLFAIIMVTTNGLVSSLVSAQEPLDYEYDVLFGINNTVESGHKLNCGWHNTCSGSIPDGDAIDFSALRLDIFAEGTISASVYAAFRYVSGTKEIKIRLAEVIESKCKVVRATILDSNDNYVATVDYIHVDASSIVENKAIIPMSSYHAANIIGIVAANEKEDCKNGGLWTGSHLHQVAYRTGNTREPSLNSSHVHLNRSADKNLGIPEQGLAYGLCIKNDRWIWKISSETEGGSFDDAVTLTPVVKASAGICPELYDLVVSVKGGSGRITIVPPDSKEKDVRTVLKIRTGAYADGWEVTLTAKPDPGFRFAGWSGDSCSGTSVTCTVTMDQGRAVTALFARNREAPTPTPTPVPTPQCTLRVSAGTGGTASGSWTGNCGTTRTVTATPDSRYRFSDWSGPVANASARTTTVYVNQTYMGVTASFTSQCTLSVSAGTGGTVSGGWSGDCGTARTVRATPDVNHVISGWLGGGCGGTGSTCTVRVGTAGGPPTTVAVTVSFRYVPTPTPTPQCSLTVSAGRGGTAGGSWTGDCGTTRTVTATPDSRYRFSGWSGPVAGASARTTTVYVNQTAMSVTASFTQQCTLTAGAGLGGSASHYSNGDCGRTETLTATASAGYCFSHWGAALGASGAETASACRSGDTTTVTVVTDLTYTAYFKRKPPARYTLTVTASGGNGYVTLSPAGGTYDAGTRVTLTANPVFGNFFARWQGWCSGTQRTCTVTMNGDRWAVAVFAAPARAEDEDEEDEGAAR